MKNVSIRIKVLLATLVALALGFGGIQLALMQGYRQDVDVAAETSVRDSSRAFDYLKQRDTAMLSAVLDTVMSRGDLRAAMSREDSATLLTLASPLFKDLKQRYGITHMYFITPGGEVLLRVHKPEQAGDKLERVTFLKARDTKGYGDGLELGKTAFALRVVHPLYSPEGKGAQPSLVDPHAEGRLVGYVEVGEEIDHFLQIMKAETGDDYGLLLAKDKLDPKAWAELRAQQGVDNDWDEERHFVLASTTSKEWAEEMTFDGAAKNVPTGGAVQGVFEEGDRTEIRGLIPVLDAKGAAAGALFVIHDLTPIASSLRDTQLRVSVVVLAMALLVAGVLVAMLNRLVFGRLARMMRNMEDVSLRLAGGDFDVHVDDPDSDDEIGRFEKFYARFIRLVAATLGDLMQRRQAS